MEGIVAIEAGLMAGDVIKKVNNKEVKDIKEFKEIIKLLLYPKECCWT
jgi:S1-C subfamily serine protease